jgi:hypothetical protein
VLEGIRIASALRTILRDACREVTGEKGARVSRRSKWKVGRTMAAGTVASQDMSAMGIVGEMMMENRGDQGRAGP